MQIVIIYDRKEQHDILPFSWQCIHVLKGEIKPGMMSRHIIQGILYYFVCQWYRKWADYLLSHQSKQALCVQKLSVFSI